MVSGFGADNVLLNLFKYKSLVSIGGKVIECGLNVRVHIESG